MQNKCVFWFSRLFWLFFAWRGVLSIGGVYWKMRSRSLIRYKKCNDLYSVKSILPPIYLMSCIPVNNVDSTTAVVGEADKCQLSISFTCLTSGWIYLTGRICAVFTGRSNHLKMHIFFRVLTPYEARSLVALLHTDDCDTLQRALVAVANSCAFSANQVLTTVSKLELLCIYLLVTYVPQ